MYYRLKYPKALGLDDTDAPLFNFKWADNMRKMEHFDFYIMVIGSRWKIHVPL